jgi:acetyl esterase/lipase
VFDELARVLQLIRPSRIAAVAIIIAVPWLVTNCRTAVYGVINAPSYIGSYERHADIRYGDLLRQSLDVYTPRGGGRHPVVVFWYGGKWTHGTKEQYRFVGAALASSGYVAALPDYRLFPRARFPEFIDDGALAVKWVREHASEFGGDPQSIFLMGHSAGAHLAATLALDERYLEKVGGSSRWIRGWISISAPYELRWLPTAMYSIFRGHATTEWRPIDLVSSHAPPALLVHGLEDDMIHPQEVVDMAAELRAAAVPVECRIYDVGHFGTVLALSPALRAEADTLADVREFIDRTVSGAASGTAAPGDACPSVSERWGWEKDAPAQQPGLVEILTVSDASVQKP